MNSMKNSKLKKKIKGASTSKIKLKIESKKYSFGAIEILSYDEIFGSERGQMLKAFGQACNCGLQCDPYATGSSDNRCAC